MVSSTSRRAARWPWRQREARGGGDEGGVGLRGSPELVKLKG
jgi:hypothetical protein